MKRLISITLILVALAAFPNSCGTRTSKVSPQPDANRIAPRPGVIAESNPRFGKRPSLDPCKAFTCKAPQVCGLDKNNRAVCTDKSDTERWPRWCCWFGDPQCRIDCGWNSGF